MNSAQIFHKKYNSRFNRHGYTMAEVLMVVAILGILAAVSFLGIFALRRNMKQTQADKNAEIIFEAAQRQMVSVVAFDADSTISLTSKDRANGIMAPVGLTDVDVDDYNMLTADPGDTRGSLQTLLLEGQVSDDLYADGWVVEYDNTSLQVKSVFYFEDGSYSDFYTSESVNQSLRESRAKRLDYQKDNKKVVGYFDGSTSSMSENKLKVYGVAKIENGEELKANVAVCATGSEAKDKEYLLTITCTGANSGAKTVQQIKLTNLMVDPWTKMRTSSVTIVLDSLKNNKQFKDTYGSITEDGIGFLTNTSQGFITINGFGEILNTDGTLTDKDFIPGEDVIISVSADTTDHAVTNTMSEVEVSANSLYASKKDDNGAYTAEVECGRHLQNLDVATSGLSLTDFATATKPESFSEMKAIQIENIDFDGDEWKDTYESGGSVRKFTPITNKDLSVYSGGSKVGEYSVKRLIVDTANTTNAGLFSEFKGEKIEYVTLIDEQIKGSASTASGSIGGLVGYIPNGTKSVEINGCQMYMSSDLFSQGMDVAKAQWMNGAANIGGLVGTSDRTLEISLSSASTVITGATQYAGGLVGSGAMVSIDKSYADCYLGGQNIGGLMGHCADTSTINGSFSAGYVVDQALATGGSIAGLTPSTIASVTDSYTVFGFGGKTDYPGTVTFYTTVAGTAAQSALYYVPASFDIPQANKIGSDRSASAMKDSTKTGFTAGIFAFRTDTSYGFNSTPYKLTDETASLVAYAYPMIILEDGKTLSQYGDWHDAISRLTVRFLYSDQALDLKNAGEITLADPLVPTSDGKYYFTEDYANAIVAHQEIQEYTNAFIPQQNYELAGREKAILYWEFTYEGKTYYYVPDSEDSYFPADNGRKYRGKIYLATDCFANILAGNVVPWDGVTPQNISNPLESVTQSMDVYARFYMSDTIQYVRMHYRIYNDSTRTSPIGRYIGRATVVKTGNKYTITTNAHSNVGGYHFYGWATTENGWDAQMHSTLLSSEIAQESSQVLTITADVIEKGDIYAIYEKIDNYPVNVEFCTYDSNNDGWGSAIYQPQYNTYSTEDWVGGSYTRRIYLPKTEDVVGYDLHKYNDTNEYKALFFTGDGSRDASKDTDIKYDTSRYASLDAAMNAGAAYVEIDITEAGTYVVTYKGQGSRDYRVDKYYLNTVSAGNAFTYHDTQQKEKIGTKYDDGVVGSNISSDKLLPDDDGFELDHYGASHTPLIGNVGDGETYVCQAYYRRKQFELFYDLNGGTYNDGSIKGYHSFEEVPYGMTLANVNFINQTTSGTLPLSMSGCEFGGWVYYKYAEVMDSGSYDGLTAYTATTMPKEAMIAVAQWHVGPNTKVILEIYRQDRENALAGTSFDDLAVPNENKTYLLQKSMEITSAVDYNANDNTKIQRKEALLNAANYTTLKNLIINSYGNRINNADSEMYRLLNGKETQYYFTDAVTTNPLLQWATIKPEIVNGDLVLRLYYDRKVITAELRYGNRTGQAVEQRDRNTAIANSATDLRITVGTYSRTYNRIMMKGLYGAHFDEPPYVWTDEYFFSYGAAGKRHLESFIDQLGSIGDSMNANSRTTWLFTYDSTNGNNQVNAYLETIDGSGDSYQRQGSTDAYTFDKNNTAYKYTYLQSGNTSNTFNPGNFHGYELWARQLNNGTLTQATDGTGYNNNQYNNFYFIRLSGLKLYLNQAHDVTTHADFAPYVGRYKDVFILPNASQVEHPTDPTKYTFGGWYSTSDFSGSPITSFTMDDHDAQVFAKWIPKTITLTYHPDYPDAADNSATFTQNALFNRATGELHQFTSADNGRILVDSTGIYYKYRPDGEDRDSTYRFDGWWRKDPVTGKYTVQLTGSEVLYEDNTDVYARWTQIEGYAYLKIRCVQVDDTSIVHEEMSAYKILLGSPQYIYAPLVNAATWNQSGVDWSGYYPTQTRVTQTFYGEEPEIVFYYSKGTALSYTVNYYVTFKPYGSTGGSDEQITLKTQEYIQSVNSAVVVPPLFDGYYLTDDVTSVTVTESDNGKVIDFYYEPDLRTIQMVAKTLYGSHQSFPEILMDEMTSLFANYPDATAGYELVPTYKIFDSKGNELTADYITSTEKDALMATLPNGTYRALGRVYLQKDGVKLMVVWDSSNYINFMMKNSDED